MWKEEEILKDKKYFFDSLKYKAVCVCGCAKLISCQRTTSDALQLYWCLCYIERNILSVDSTRINAFGQVVEKQTARANK